MSGPKTSRYRLTPAQRRALIAQRERERRIGEARANIVHLTAKLNSVVKLPESAAEQAEALRERTGEDGGYSAQRKKLEEIVSAALKKLSSLEKNASPDKLEKAVSDAKRSLDDAVKLRGVLEGISAENLRALRQDITDSLDRNRGADFSSLTTPEQKRVRELKQELEDRLAAIPQAELSDALRQDIADAGRKLSEIDSEDFLRNFRSMTVTALEKECRGYTELRREIGGEYDRLLSRYHAVCEEYGAQPQGVPFGREAPERLERLIAEIEAELDRSDEQSYISHCIDEVMENMGYDLIGSRSVVKKSGAAFRSELYSFGEGTAVNVTYSASGSITMELGGLDYSDRIPEPAEADRLTEDMRSFCGRFGEFERRLLEKGVESEHISLLPPDKAYAQIINASDYDMTKEISAAEFSEERRDISAPKEMNADE